jgi:hypothetical protein
VTQTEGDIATVVVPRTSELPGGFPVRRILPSRARRMVGPFIFVDQMGPEFLRAGDGLDYQHFHELCFQIADRRYSEVKGDERALKWVMKRRHDSATTEKQIREILASDSPPSVENASRELGLGLTTLYRYVAGSPS